MLNHDEKGSQGYLRAAMNVDAGCLVLEGVVGFRNRQAGGSIPFVGSRDLTHVGLQAVAHITARRFLDIRPGRAL